MTKFSNKTFLILGATSDIGYQICKDLDLLEANLIIIYRNSKKVNNLKKILTKKDHSFYRFDFNNPNLINKLINEKFNKKIKFDGLVNLLGMHQIKPAMDITINDIDAMFNINFKSPILFLNKLIRKKLFVTDASVIFLSTVASLKVEQGLSLYSSMKIAQKMFLKTLSSEVYKKKININFISPGLIESETLNRIKKRVMSNVFLNLEKKHLKGFGKKEDITPLILFLLSNESKWMNGSDIVIDGGYMLT